MLFAPLDGLCPKDVLEEMTEKDTFYLRRQKKLIYKCWGNKNNKEKELSFNMQRFR